MRILCAPSAPHLPVCRFQLAGKALAIHQRRLLHPIPHGCPQGAQPLGIMRQIDGLGGIFLFGKGNQFFKPNRAQQACPDPRHMGFSCQDNDRDPHPQGFAGGGCAIVWEGVEGDIDFTVHCQVVDVGRRFSPQGYALGRDALLHEVPEEEFPVFFVAQQMAFDEKRGLRNRFQYAGPGSDHGGVDFREVVEGAKAEVSFCCCGRRGDGRGCFRRRVAEKAIRQAHQCLGVQVFRFPCWVGDGIGQAVVHFRQAGGVGVAQIGDLDGGGLSAENPDSGVCRMACEVDQDVDPVRKDDPGGLRVLHGRDVPPLVRQFLQASSDRVLLRPIGVTDELRVLPGVVPGDRHEEEGDRMVLEVRRDIADPEPAVWIPFPFRELKMVCCRRTQSGSQLPVHAEYVLRKGIVEIVEEKEGVVDGDVGKWVHLQGPEVMAQRLFVSALLEQGAAEIVQGFFAAPILRQRPLEAVNRLADVSAELENYPQVGQRGMVAWLEGYAGALVGDGLLFFSAGDEGLCQVEMGIAMAGIDLQGLLMALPGLPGVVPDVIEDAEVVPGVGLVWLESQGFLVAGDGGIDFFSQLQDKGEMIEEFRVLRLQGRGLVEKPSGPAVVAEAVGAQPREKKGLGVGGFFLQDFAADCLGCAEFVALKGGERLAVGSCRSSFLVCRAAFGALAIFFFSGHCCLDLGWRAVAECVAILFTISWRGAEKKEYFSGRKNIFKENGSEGRYEN